MGILINRCHINIHIYIQTTHDISNYVYIWSGLGVIDRACNHGNKVGSWSGMRHLDVCTWVENQRLFKYRFLAELITTGLKQ